MGRYPGDPNNVLCSVLHGGARASCTAAQVIGRSVDKATDTHAGSDPPAPATSPRFLSRINERGECFGADIHVVTQGFNDECERELEREAEEEEEVEREVPGATPSAETDWAYSSALVAGSVLTIPSSANVSPLRTAMAGILSCTGTNQVAWSDRVFCTRNFINTASRNFINKDEYLRIPDVILLWPISGEVLLVSEREANGLVMAFWNHGEKTRISGPILAHLAYSRPVAVTESAVRSGVPLGALAMLGGLGLSTGGGAQWMVPGPPALTTLQIFAGETTLQSGAVRAELRTLLPTGLAGQAAEALVSSRGLDSMMPHSDLYKELRRMKGERL